MGDRYELQLGCAECGLEQEAYYAESCGFFSFKCIECKKINWINMDFRTEIITEKERKRRMNVEGFGELEPEK